MVETGIEIQGTFASEIQKEGKVIGWRSDDNQTQAIIKDETIEIRIEQDEWKTTKTHWNEALRDEKTIQHNNVNIKATKRTLLCSTDDSTMVARHLTESYTELRSKWPAGKRTGEMGLLKDHLRCISEREWMWWRRLLNLAYEITTECPFERWKYTELISLQKEIGNDDTVKQRPIQL
jgi:hypothetical protein